MITTVIFFLYIQEDSLQKTEEEEKKHKEVASKFQTTLNEITELMKQDSDKAIKLRDDNLDMTSKLKNAFFVFRILQVSPDT